MVRTKSKLSAWRRAMAGLKALGPKDRGGLEKACLRMLEAIQLDEPAKHRHCLRYHEMSASSMTLDVLECRTC